MQEFFIASGLAAILVASYTDIRKREVADYLSYGLIGFGFAANLMAAIAFSDYSFIIESIAGFLAMLAIALLMYYTGQWGGGDSKLLMGMGALIGIPVSSSVPFIQLQSFLISFWLNLLIAGVVYALAWSMYVAIRNRKKFINEMKHELDRQAKLRRLALIAAALLIVVAFALDDLPAKFLLATAAVLIAVLLYLTAFSKAVEKTGMLKLVEPSVLTEGDWIAEDVVVLGKRIAGPKDLGVSKKQIVELKKLYEQKKIGKVLLKSGIPFVPSFLAAYILTIFFGNLFL